MGVRVDMCSTLVISYKLFPNHLCHSTPTPSDAHEPHLSTELNVLSLPRLDHYLCLSWTWSPHSDPLPEFYGGEARSSGKVLNLEAWAELGWPLQT